MEHNPLILILTLNRLKWFNILFRGELELTQTEHKCMRTHYSREITPELNGEEIIIRAGYMKSGTWAALYSYFYVTGTASHRSPHPVKRWKVNYSNRYKD